MRALGFVVWGFIAAILWLVLPARASFVNGVETFDGTQLDDNTWEFFSLNPGRASAKQNDQLNLVGVADVQIPGVIGGSDCDYTTRNRLVHPGDKVLIDTLLKDSVEQGHAQFMIFLTDNSFGATGPTLSDSQWLQLRVPERDQILAFRGGDGGGSGRALDSPSGELVLAPFANVPITYEIDFIDVNDARFKALNPDGSPFATQTLHFEEPLPKDLAISVYAPNGNTVTFDNVTVIPIPSPAALWPGISGLIAVALMVRFRRCLRSDRDLNVAPFDKKRATPRG